MIRNLLGAACAILATGTVAAQEAYPTRPITLIVPFTAGASSDVTARAIAQKISGPLGQPVVIDNRAGATGGIGMQAAARAEPDGYTLVVGTVSSTIVPSIISKNVHFDLFKDFTPVATMANTPLLLVVTKDSPFRTVADVVAEARRKPDTLTYGDSAGLYRIAMEALNDQAGIAIQGIPFRGPAQAATELLGGRLSVNPDALGSIMPMLKGDRMRALAVFGGKRTPALPEVPTMIEQGFEDFEFNGWLGILAPAGTPEHVVQRLEQEIAKAVEAPEIRKLYAGLGLEPTVLSAQQYGDAMRSDLQKYQSVAEKAGIERQ
ncbi:tripartite tricarboxylate transporter substrate binding protein [Verticiella sediminum]|uniref:Tripartite tricarboxylate transporter substrate binding protein n=1 Tax=Verticiella sediminum TaxID=1247510 RepID=A0A556AJK3_9BURK|nr:tripartite tricarboxylate transporter substrate binding protein [Verticiella sediminum]TSH93061.1 tripartite tricarboxylate transporter substrate binding protein [Verticiella sediminum]